MCCLLLGAHPITGGLQMRQIQVCILGTATVYYYYYDGKEVGATSERVRSPNGHPI